MEFFENSPFVLHPQQNRSRIALARIIAGATEVLLREGKEGFSMADIAKAAGVPVGSIYGRFKGKDSIIQAIVLDTFRRIEDIIRDRMQGHHFASAGEVISELAAGMATISEHNQAMIRLIISYSTVNNDQLRAIVTVARQKIIGHYKKAISPFLTNLPEQRRDIMISISYEIVSSAFISKSRGDVPILIDLAWSDLAQEVTKAATSYLREAA
jgi:AcrR family transcriptional regulator